jgi:hypothetical protein
MISPCVGAEAPTRGGGAGQGTTTWWRRRDVTGLVSSLRARTAVRLWSIASPDPYLPGARSPRCLALGLGLPQTHFCPAEYKP